MPDIVTGKIFVDGEKGITATKMNQIISQAVIQPSFVTSKPSSSTLDPTDQMLEVKGAGTYATITGAQLISSVSASVTQNITPTIWSVRLRSFQAIGNSTTECDQRQCGSSVTFGVFSIDRYNTWKQGSMALTAQQQSENVNVPGTSFAITSKFLRTTLTTAQATLGATDSIQIYQAVEGISLRELINDVHSLQILVRSSVSGLNFGMVLSDPGNTKALAKLCTIPSANTWTLLTFANLPIWAAGGNFGLGPGNAGYQLKICLGAGSSQTVAANDTWQSGNFAGALGQDNFASKTVGSTFDIAYISHEPGAQCSNPPMDLSFGQNLDGPMGCLRYYCKSYGLGVKAGTSGGAGCLVFSNPMSSGQSYVFGTGRYPKIMAKVPTVTIYDPGGGINTLAQLLTSNHYAVAGVQDINEVGFDGVNLSSSFPANAWAQFHYTADTGW